MTSSSSLPASTLEKSKISLSNVEQGSGGLAGRFRELWGERRTLKMPKLRHLPFETAIIERYKRPGNHP